MDHSKLSGALSTVVVEYQDGASARNMLATYIAETNTFLGVSFVEHLRNNMDLEISDKTWITAIQHTHHVSTKTNLPEDTGKNIHLKLPETNNFCSVVECRVWGFLTLVYEIVISLFFSVCLFYIVWKVSWLTCWIYRQTLKEILNICSKLPKFKSGDEGCLFFFSNKAKEQQQKKSKGSELINLHEFIPLKEYYMAQEIPSFRLNVISKVSHGSPDLKSWWEETMDFDWGSAVNNWEQWFPELLSLNRQICLYSEAAPVRLL